MCQVVLLVIAVLQGDEDAQIVRAGDDADAGAGKLCAELVEAARRYPLFRAVNVEGRNGWVVRRLLGEVGDAD